VQCCKVTPDQRLFFLSSPTFDLPFCRDRIFNLFEFLLEDQNDRASPRRIAIEETSLMLREPLAQAAARRTDVIGNIGAA
jgi:hypothetical protein